MDVRAFLQQVIAWEAPGFTTVHWKHHNRKGFHGHSCHTVDEVLETVARILKDSGNDIYFCLSRQKLNSGKRSRAAATALMSVFADLDVETGNPKKYQNQAEAIVALLEFCKQSNIPLPSVVVASGGGIHAYWLSDRALTVAEWQPFADALKAAGVAYGLLFDAGVTGDAARILRVPETDNWKIEGTPRPVFIIEKLSLGTRYDFTKAFGKIVTVSNVIQFPPKKPGKPSKLSSGIDLPPPPDLDKVYKACPWMNEANETGGKNFHEPLWNLTTLIATFYPNGKELAHKWGDMHPGYTPASTDEKYVQKWQQRQANPKLGWPSCRSIAGQGSTHCATCKYLALEQSPLNHGMPPPGTPPPPIKDEVLEAIDGRRPEDMHLPEWFCVDESDRICFIHRAKVKPGQTGAYMKTRMFQTKIWRPTLQFHDGTFGLAFMAASDMHGTHEVFIGSADACQGSVQKNLAKNFVLMESGDKNTMAVLAERLLHSWMHKLAQERVALRDSGTMGWRYEHGKLTGFAYGKVLYLADGTEAELTNPGDDEFKRWYLPVGSKEAWLRAAKLITDRQQVELDIILAVAFAAPLVIFIGNMYAAVLSVWGDPGSSKSTAQQVAAAVWGHPKQTRESLTSTPKSVQGRLGRIKNLPAYWDDIQDERHQDYLSQTMFVATEGTEGGRLNPDATYKERKDWQTMLLACSNASFVEYLLKKQKSTTAGLRRVLEFEFNKRQNVDTGMINSVDANRVFADLEHNYGVVGQEYAKLLATEHEQVKILVKTTTDAFSARIKGEPDETFWWGMCGVLIAGATLAKRLGVNLDVPRLADFLEAVLQNNRRIRGSEGTEGGSFANTEMGLSGFMNKYINAGNIIWVARMYEHRSIPVNTIGFLKDGKQIMIQVARDERKIVISKRALRNHLNEEGIHTRQVLEGLAKYFKATETKLTLGAGTPTPQVQEAVIEIPVPVGNKMLEQVLFAKGKPDGEDE